MLELSAQNLSNEASVIDRCIRIYVFQQFAVAFITGKQTFIQSDQIICLLSSMNFKVQFLKCHVIWHFLSPVSVLNFLIRAVEAVKHFLLAPRACVETSTVIEHLCLTHFNGKKKLCSFKTHCLFFLSSPFFLFLNCILLL